MLAEAWLQAYVDTSEDAIALSEFKISEVSYPFLFNDTMDHVVRDSISMTWERLLNGAVMYSRIIYSVKPKIKGFVWRTGNGRWNEETGWIINKNQYALIRKIKDKIEIYEMGTGL